MTLRREEHTDWLSTDKWPALETYMQVMLYVLNKLFRKIYVDSYTFIHAITIDEKRDHEFEGDQAGIYGRDLEEEREGRNVEIKIQSQK